MNDTALIVIDVQQALSGPDSQLRDGAAFLARVSQLVEAARAASTPVIFVQHDGGTGDELERLSSGWEINPVTGYRPGDTVVEKQACDSFYETNLPDLLADLGVKRVVLAGMMTEYCVDTTCRRAFSSGYKVVVISDCHATFDNERLTADQIIDHHNSIWSGSFADVRLAREFNFSQMEAVA